MKNTIATIVIFAVAALAVAKFSDGSGSHGNTPCCSSMMAMQSSPTMDKAMVAKPTKGVQKATILIEDGKYSPATISVKKGKPVELTFKAGKNAGCGSTVVFNSLKISKDVPSGKSVVVKFTAKEAGKIHFTCPMGMYNGDVVVK